MTTALTVSAPGSVMLTGEHAVVHGHPAIVCAVEQRITLTATPLTRPVLEIRSEIADPAKIALTDLAPTGPYRFVQAAVAGFVPALTATEHPGLRLEITSEIDPTLGLGSSAAVTIAALAALTALTGADPAGIHPRALAIVREIQRRGSGADLAASLTGGMCAYRLPPEMTDGVPPPGARADIVPLPVPPPIALCYAGYKTPTAEVLARIAAAMKGHEDTFHALYARMGDSAARAIDHARARDWPAFGVELQNYQQMMAELGVCDATMAAIIDRAAGTPGLLAAKISGSGLGDCVLALGAQPDGFIPTPLARKGVIVHD